MKLNIELNKNLKDNLISIWSGARVRKLYYNDMTEEEQKKLDSAMWENFKILDSAKVPFKVQNLLMHHSQNNIDCSFKDSLNYLNITLV